MLGDLFLLFLIALVGLAQWLDGTVPWLMLFFFSFYVLALTLRERQNQKREDFLNQLRMSRKELRNGGTVFLEGKCLRYETVLTTYFATIGNLFSVVVIPSRFHFIDEGRSAGALALSLLSLISGWWSPTGPIHTLATLHQNFLGGQKNRVCDLIDSCYLRKKAELEIS